MYYYEEMKSYHRCVCVQLTRNSGDYMRQATHQAFSYKFSSYIYLINEERKIYKLRHIRKHIEHENVYIRVYVSV